MPTEQRPNEQHNLAEIAGNNITCYGCRNLKLCVIYSKVKDGLQSGHFNIDSNELPGKMADIYIAVAKSCFYFNK